MLSKHWQLNMSLHLLTLGDLGFALHLTVQNTFPPVECDTNLQIPYSFSVSFFDVTKAQPHTILNLLLHSNRLPL